MEHQTFRKVLWSLEDIRRVSIRCEAWDDTVSREAMHHGKRKGKQKGSQPLIRGTGRDTLGFASPGVNT